MGGGIHSLKKIMFIMYAGHTSHASCQKGTRNYENQSHTGLTDIGHNEFLFFYCQAQPQLKIWKTTSIDDDLNSCKLT